MAQKHTAFASDAFRRLLDGYGIKALAAHIAVISFLREFAATKATNWEN
ncbi:MAG: hypothetical protein Q8P35_01505 [Candidatus Yanofskybacteria bacterium]|nr:hypothetical protein [Candidatus Yanofskybacteria bacterium]